MVIAGANRTYEHVLCCAQKNRCEDAPRVRWLWWLSLALSIYLDRSANFKLNVGDRIDGHDTPLCYYRMCCGPQRWSVVRVCPSPFMQEDALLHFGISLSRALFPVALADAARHGHLYCDFATKTLQKVGMGMKY